MMNAKNVRQCAGRAAVCAAAVPAGMRAGREDAKLLQELLLRAADDAAYYQGVKQSAESMNMYADLTFAVKLSRGLSSALAGYEGKGRKLKKVRELADDYSRLADEIRDLMKGGKR